MQIKYAIREISPTCHPAYLQQGDYGLCFSYRASQPYGIHYFDTREEAVDWIKTYKSPRYVEVVEVFISYTYIDWNKIIARAYKDAFCYKSFNTNNFPR